ncbi:MAG: hypothetical protein GY774_03545 [Planctomycetes bacterium]|nr:hypothetical protein [Planctomycetota bacterium]
MFRKMIYLVSFVLVLTLVGNVSADIQFPDTTGDHLWSTPENWATGALPTLNDGYLRLFTIPGPTIMAGESYVVNGIHLGNDTGGQAGALTLQGGTLEVGTINCGYKGTGTINIIDGTLIVTGNLKIARESTAIGHINLNGGTISTNNFLMREKGDAVGTLDVGGGMLTIDGDETSLVQDYIDNGWITTYDGNGTLNLDYNVTNPGLTTLAAVHNLSPDPANRAIVKPGEVELTWTLPDPSVPGQAVSVDVYFTDDLQALEQFTDPAAIQVVNKQNVTSVVVQTQTKTRYYWAVDAYVDSASDFPAVGPIFSFMADNAPPKVNAGPDISTFLQDGTRTGTMSPVVTDDGAIQPYTVTWSVLAQPSDADPALPDAVIADPAAEQTTVTVSAEGIYVLQLEADDGEYTNSDTVTINVHPDDWTQ